MATWPSTIPVTRTSYTETPPERVTRTQMEAGIAKTRRRYTNAARQINLSLFLTDAQVETLDTFFLANDALRFDFTDPRTSTTVEARFLSPPKYNRKETMWSVTVSMEFLP